VDVKRAKEESNKDNTGIANMVNITSVGGIFGIK
jgi:hypothetical protein